MTEDLHSLVGVYTLDALDPIERRRFEAHLERCETCSAEVGGMAAAAAALASVVSEPPPPTLRASLLSQVAEARQDGPVVLRPTRRVSRLGRVVLSVAAAIGLVVGVLAVANRGSGPTTGSQIASIVAAHDAKVIDLRNRDADLMMRVVWSPSAGKAAVVATGLADPGAGRAYEMWSIGAGGPRPAGLLRPNAQGEVRVSMGLDLAGATMVAVTVEPAGGSEKPTSMVLASGVV